MIGINAQINLRANKAWDANINKYGCQPVGQREAQAVVPFVLAAATASEPALSSLTRDGLILPMIFLFVDFKV